LGSFATSHTFICIKEIKEWAMGIDLTKANLKSHVHSGFISFAWLFFVEPSI